MIPLAYIVRDMDTPIPNIVYPTSHDQLVECAILQGAEYNTNNGIVYDLLQSLTLNGPAWPWINGFQRTRDGRRAWKSLVAYYEGDSIKTRSKQECYDSIAKATYQGTKRNFDFSTYVAIHQQAHQDLIRLGEPIPENKKVRDFLHGIIDPQCATIKLSVLANPTFMNNFPQAVNYMASTIDLTTKNTAAASREISEVQRTDGGGGRARGRGGRQNTRGGYGRGGRGGRGYSRGGGRGRGRGRGRDNTGPGRGNSSEQSIARGYSHEEWQNLSTAERSRIYRERDRLETARTIAAVIREQQHDTAIHDDISTITTTVNNSGNGNNSSTGTPAANQQCAVAQVSRDNVSQAMSRRRIGAYHTVLHKTRGSRKHSSISSIYNKQNHEIQPSYCRAELDSHADTCGVNNTAYVLEYTGKVAEVAGFSKALQTRQDVPIVKAALAYD